MLKALADPVRLRLMSMILSHKGGEACAMCDLTEGFDLSQSTLSHHLKVLNDAGLVDRDKQGLRNALAVPRCAGEYSARDDHQGRGAGRPLGG